MIYPNFNKVKKLASEFRCIPICREIFADVQTPIEVLKILKTVSQHCFILESLESPQKWGRYTFLGFDPSLELTCTNGKMCIRTGTEIQFETRHPRETIQKILDENYSPRLPGLPPFTGGLVGYFSYDYIKYAEPTLNLDAKDTEGFHDVDLMLFDKVIAFDNLRQKIILIVNIHLTPKEAERQSDLETEYRHAEMELENLVQLIEHGKSANFPPGRVTSEFRALFDQESYSAIVEKARHYIHEGDIFQVVLSNRLDADFEGSLLNTYRVFRVTNPSPYMFYFSSDTAEIAGASPETLVKLEGEMLHTFPLAGTRPRGKTPEEDKVLEVELLADEKERSEHNMLVDLGRNDLGKISEFGSVSVEKYMEILRFSHVMHIGSTVCGTIRHDKNALDAIEAVLPAGTLSGAPKIRACEIINELENNKRGIYGGAIGYIDFTGNLDLCIAIRLVFRKNGKIFIRSGAGIVADSVPEREFQECINKAKAVVEAVHSSLFKKDTVKDE